jgi:alkylation response protein AidB-like acyl-CoA dehydrogenase
VDLGRFASRGWLALSRSMAYHPEIQHAIADMVIELESIGPHLEKIAEDWSNGVDHGALWPSKIFAAKYRAVEGAWRVVDLGWKSPAATESFVGWDWTKSQH